MCGEEALESQYIENIVPSYDGTSTLALVFRLLTEVLTEDKKQLVIISKPEGYIYDSTKNVEIRDPVRLLITGAELTEKGSRTEITMSCTIEDRNDEKHNCSLYFTMNKNVIVTQVKTAHIKKMIGKSLTLSLTGTSGNLYDSLYSLILQGNNGQGEYMFGDGRGYLVFTRDA